jgi:hypothetical protein
MFAARKDIDEWGLTAMLETLSKLSQKFHRERDFAAVAKKFNLDEGDVTEWWETVSYPEHHGYLREEELSACVRVLFDSGVVTEKELAEFDLFNVVSLGVDYQEF